MITTARSVDQGLEFGRRAKFPVTLKATYVLGGWERITQNTDELKIALEEGLPLSPLHEALLIDSGPPTVIEEIALKFGWMPEEVEEKINKIGEILNIRREDTLTFLLESFIPSSLRQKPTNK